MGEDELNVGIFYVSPVYESRELPYNERARNSANGVDLLSGQSDNIQVYPNPVQRTVFFSFNALEEGPVEVQIKDLLGKTVYSKTVAINGNSLHAISLSGYSNGVYFVTVEKDQNIIYRTKIIKDMD